MKHLFIAIMLLLTVNVFATESEFVSGRLIIKVKDEFVSIGKGENNFVVTEQNWFNNLALQYEINSLRKLFVSSSFEHHQKTYICKFPEGTDLETIKTAFESETPNVTEVRFDVYAYLCTNDTYNNAGLQWSLDNIFTEQAHDILVEIDAPPFPVIVAVIDTGIDFDHPDLAENMLCDATGSLGFNSIMNIPDFFDDDHGHGTLVAGTIATVTNNETGIASLVNRTDLIKLLPIKAFNYSNTGTASQVEEGIQIAIDDFGATVINMSFEFDNYEYELESLHSTIDEYLANNPEIIFVNSAGTLMPNPNYFRNAMITWDAIITVGSSNRENGYSSWCPNSTDVEIAAPGGIGIIHNGQASPQNLNNVLSTLPVYNVNNPYYSHTSQEGISEDQIYGYEFGNWIPEENPDDGFKYDFYEGTSLSAGYVSSLVALLQAKYYSELESSTMTRDDLIDILYRATSVVEANNELYGDTQYYGNGIINAGTALSNPKPYLKVVDNGISINENTIEWPSQMILEWGHENEISINFLINGFHQQILQVLLKSLQKMLIVLLVIRMEVMEFGEQFFRMRLEQIQIQLL